MDCIDWLSSYECSMKKLTNMALIYAILALVGGVFFREFTKFNDFTGITSLSVVHTHYLILGVGVALLVLILERTVTNNQLLTKKLVVLYNVGLNTTCIMFLVRGITQVLGTPLASGANAAISGIAGLGHIMLGISIIWGLVRLKKIVAE